MLIFYTLINSNSYGATSLITIDYSSSLGVINPSIFGTIIRGNNTDTAFSLLSTGHFGIGEILFQEDSPINPNDPSQYNFIAKDSVFRQMYKYGIAPLVSFNLFSPPLSYSNYSIYVRNILRHYTQGWNNGFNYSIKNIRFGNEPDGGFAFWSGTQSEFFRTYRTFALSVKTLDPNFIIQGPGLRFGVNTTSPIPASYAIDFLNYCRDSSVPLDCLSFHAYNPVLYYDFNNNWKVMNTFLSNYSTVSPIYGKPRLANDEWNLALGDFFTGIYQEQLDTAWAAAHNVAGLIYMIEGGVQQSIRFGGPFIYSDQQHDFSMVNYPDYSPKPVYCGMKIINTVAGTERLYTLGSDSINLAVISGKLSNDTVSLVIANYDTYSYLTLYHPNTNSPQWNDYRRSQTDLGISGFPTYQGSTVILKNLNWTDTTQRIVMERYLVDDTTHLEKTETQYFSASSIITVYIPLSAPSVQLVLFYPELFPTPMELSEFFAIPGSGKEELQ